MNESIPKEFRVGKIQAKYVGPDKEGYGGSYEVLHDNMEEPVEIDLEEIYDFQSIMALLDLHKYASTGNEEALAELEQLTDELEAEL